MALLLLLLLAATAAAAAGETMERPARHGMQDYGGAHPYERDSSRKLSAAAAWEPIRIATFFVEADVRITIAQREFLQASLLPAAIAHYERALRVVPAARPLFVGANCNSWWGGTDPPVCAELREAPTCGAGGPEFDPAHLRNHRVCGMCSIGGSCSRCRQACTRTGGCRGVPDADFVLYVTAKATAACRQGSIASAINSTGRHSLRQTSAPTT